MSRIADDGANPAQGVTLVGAGFVADLYMRSLQTFPHIKVHGVFDRDPDRLQAFAEHWDLPQFSDLETALQATPPKSLVLNLTNPKSHNDVTRAALLANRHVFSEKPMVLSFDEAKALTALAEKQGVQLATAPSSVLSETAQTLSKAIRDGVCGSPRLIYAELDDGFIPQAPVTTWISASGAPWPYADEFQTGCTLEHAGYYLSWLIGIFGAVTEVTTTVAELVSNKLEVTSSAPDFSVAVLRFADGPVARLTCSIAAPHDHKMQVVGDAGVIRIPRAWDNAAPVKFHKRLRIRRRLMEHPLGRRIKISGPTHPKVKRQGAAAMNFALGPAEMLDAIAAGRTARLAGDYALHLTEVTLACQQNGIHTMTTGCPPMEAMPWAR